MPYSAQKYAMGPGSSRPGVAPYQPSAPSSMYRVNSSMSREASTMKSSSAASSDHRLPSALRSTGIGLRWRAQVVESIRLKREAARGVQLHHRL